MKRTPSIASIRKIATIAVLCIVTLFVGFMGFLWISYGDILSGDVKSDTDKRLLTDFDGSKFDSAVERLQKRRNLEGPAEGIHDPFGTVPR